MLNKNFLPGNLIFARAYAAKDENITLPNVPQVEMNTVLNMYLEKGTQEVDISEKRSEKFFTVGLTT